MITFRLDDFIYLHCAPVEYLIYYTLMAELPNT